MRSLNRGVEAARRAAVSLQLVVRVESLPFLRRPARWVFTARCPTNRTCQEGLRRWSGSKRLAVPAGRGRCDASFRLRSPDPCPGSLRILEPGPEARLCPPGEIDLLLIPGVAFTREGRVAAVAVGITTVISRSPGSGA